MDRISICESLLKLNELNPFLKCLLTCSLFDEKWIRYDKDVRKRSKPGEKSQMVANPELTPRKVMLIFYGTERIRLL